MAANSHISVSVCDTADIPRATNINLNAMGREHPIVNEVYPGHFTTQGRQAAIKRHSDPAFRADQTMHHLKIVDWSVGDLNPASLGLLACDPFIGYGRWQIKRLGEAAPRPPPSDGPPRSDSFGDWWPTKHDRDFVAWVCWAYYGRRQMLMSELSKNRSIYCTLSRHLSIIPHLLTVC